MNPEGEGLEILKEYRKNHSIDELIAQANGVTEQSASIAAKKELLKNLPELPGQWMESASITRFGRTKLTPGMLGRFLPKFIPIHLGYKIDGEPSMCWSWQRGTHDSGYGRFYLGMDPKEPGRRIWAYSHRVSFEEWIGILPPGYIADHECEHKTCVNPLHLAPLSGPDNTRATSIRTPYRRRNQYSVD